MRNERFGQIYKVLIVAVALVGCSAKQSSDPPSTGTVIKSASAGQEPVDAGHVGEGAAGKTTATSTGTGSGGQQAPGTGGNGPLVGSGGQTAGTSGTGGMLSVPPVVDAGVPPGGDDDDDVGPADAAVADAGVDAGLGGGGEPDDN